MKSKLSVVIEFQLLAPPKNKREELLFRHSVSKGIADFIEKKVYKSTALKGIHITKVGVVPSDSYTMAELDEVNWFQKDRS